MKIIILNQFSEICKVNETIEDLAKSWNLSLRISAQLSLVLDELLTNIIRYAYVDEDDHMIEINLEIQKDVLYIKVIDDGIEFNPLQHPEPDLNPNLAEREIGGLGIHLIKKLTQEFVYLRKDGFNIQKLCKYLV